MNLDFRTKLLMTVVIATCIVSGHIPHRYPIVAILIAATPYILFFIEGRPGLAVRGLVLIGLALSLNIIFLNRRTGIINSILLAVTGILLYMIPGFMMGYYALVTTRISDLIGSLKKMRLPDQLIIPISVAFRFFYSTREDYRNISESMKILGLDYRAFFKAPLVYIEYKIVPLLMCAVNAADDVAISAVARGMKVGKPRSTISDARLRTQDYIVLGLCLLLMVFYLYVRWEVANA